MDEIEKPVEQYNKKAVIFKGYSLRERITFLLIFVIGSRLRISSANTCLKEASNFLTWSNFT